MNRSQKLVSLSLTVVAVFSFFIYQKATAAPTLREGTYLSGQTLSVWPSWSLLGNTLGRSLPTDPINQLGLAGTCATTTNRFCLNDGQCPNNEACVLHDPSTGWSTTDRRFSFACNRESFAYRYIVSTSTGAYTVRANFEDPGFTPANFNNFVAGFISTSIVRINEPSGICSFDQEISTFQSGVCGDGRLNPDRGEQCDPPGRIEYQAGCVGAIKNLNVCNNSCVWVASTTLCSNFRRCGNGERETGETCDDGAFNGRYNHCNSTCNGFSPLGRCGNGVVESAYEVCDPGTGQVRYGTTGQQSSCSWDCQNWGPYCGNGTVESQFGEECDGSQACSVGDVSGERVCTSNCRMAPKAGLVAWWNMTGLNDSASSNNGTCTPVSACPTNAQTQDGRNFLMFQGNDYFVVGGSPGINLVSSGTVQAWIKPQGSALNQRVIEKGASAYGYWYDIEVNATASGTARFNFANYSTFSVDSTSRIPTNTWTHIAGTFERIGQTNYIKIYVNGVLEGSREVLHPPSVNIQGWAPLSVGASRAQNGTLSNFFLGDIDDIKIYNRALTADEVMSDFQSNWPCSATSSPSVSNQPGVCGNNIVDNNEACDRGADNGRVCTPGYGQSCTYCSTDCQNTIDVQPSQYCGNGIIESSERCDTTPGGVIYTAATNTNNTTLPTRDSVFNGFQELACSGETSASHTLKKGTKSCGDCSLGVIRNCVQCGVKSDGVTVGGGLINVLQSRTNPDPLFAADFYNSNTSSLNLSIGPCYYIGLTGTQNVCNRLGSLTNPSNPVGGRIVQSNLSADLTNYTLQNPYGTGNARLESNLQCSTNDSNNRRYWMYINKDWTRPFAFSVVENPQTWQNDMVLSPIILRAFNRDGGVTIRRNQDVRVVVSWVGPDDFSGGIINPFVNPQEINGASYCPYAYCGSLQRSYSVGINYFEIPNSNWYGVWYHGFNSTVGQTNAESFTINAGAMSGNTYSFFVKSPNIPIRQFRNTARLKVEVYLPEVGNSVYQSFCCEPTYIELNRRRFGTPVKTYYLLGASPSDNQNAKYWQVFNINKPVATTTVSSTDIIDVSSIVTGPANFQYFVPLIVDPNANNNSSYIFTPPAINAPPSPPVVSPNPGITPPIVAPNPNPGGGLFSL